MSLRDIFRKNKIIAEAEWTPEIEDVFSSFGKGWGNGQRRGRITGLPRNRDAAVGTTHQNRAGRRMYVRINQTRRFRKDVLGWGRWKRHDEHGDHHQHCRDTAIQYREPRKYRRLDDHRAYREARQERLRAR